MKYSFIGKDTVVSEAIKNKTIQKLSKLEKFLPEETEAVIRYKVTKLENKIEVTIPLNKRILRSEVISKDMYEAIDKVSEILEKQITRYKDRLKDKIRRNSKFKEEFINFFKENTINEKQTNNKIEIKKSKKIDIKPMDAEEAIMEMELVHHNFFVFINSTTNEVNVVYKRRDGAYGLIEAEY